MPEWRIYYADGSTFDSTRGNVMDAPSLGVQVVLIKDGIKNRRVLYYADYYIWRPSLRRWTDHQDSASLILAAAHEPWTKVVCGQYMREKDFEQILIKAQNDPDFPSQRR